MSGIEESTNILGMVSGVNVLSNGLFIGLTLLFFWVALFIILKFKFETTVALMSTSFGITIVSVLFWGAGLIGANILFYPIIMLLISVIINISQDG